MKNATEIICVVDKSGSMEAVASDAIGGFNAFLKDQQALPGEASLTLALFDAEYALLHDGVPIADAPPLDRASYRPSGMTALYDAVVRTIESVGRRLAETPEEDRPDKVIMVILTDGLENSSREFPGEPGARAVRERIEHQREKYNWEFLFLAANQDAVLSGGELGVRADRAQTFVADAEGTSRAFAMQSAAVTSFRACGDVGSDWREDA